MILVRDPDGQALTAPTVEEAQRLWPTVTPRPVDTRGRMFLRAALSADLARIGDRVHVSPVYGSRLP